jgi:hypothetical protein
MPRRLDQQKIIQPQMNANKREWDDAPHLESSP